MSLGILLNCSAVLGGILCGSALEKRISSKLIENLPTVFGMCGIGIAINSIILASNMTIVVLAILLGFCIGQLLGLEFEVRSLFLKILSKNSDTDSLDMELFVTISDFSL